MTTRVMLRTASAYGKHLPAMLEASNVSKRMFSQKKAVIFDFGGVIVPSPVSIVNDFQLKHGLSKEQLQELLFEGGDESLWGLLETGACDVEGFGKLLEEKSLQLLGRALPDDIVIPMSKHVAACSPYPQMINALHRIRDGGIKTALLTNNWKWKEGKNIPLDLTLFDVVVESYIEKLRKPNPLIYELTLKRLNVDASDAVFIDDLAVNLKPARSMGITTIKCSNIESTLFKLGDVLGIKFIDNVPGTIEVSEQHQLPMESLKKYLMDVLHLEDDSSPMVVRKFKHGQSNPTYYVRFGGEELVLRKKPPGKLLPSAHAVEREYRVMKAVGGCGVPIPKLYDLCEDSSIVGTPFYIMKYMRGRIFEDPKLPDVSASDRTKIYNAMNEVLQKIHSVDLDKAELRDFGKEGNYMLRNTRTWTKQYEAAKTEEQPHMNKLMDWLAKHAPNSERHTVVHGDFRVDNMIFNDDLEVIAVLDWELSTTGDPLSDLGYNCVVHHLPADFPVFGGMKGLDLDMLGIPSESKYMEKYLYDMKYNNNNNNIPDMDPYMAFAYFRLAAICQGVYKRSLQGQASSTKASQLGAVVNMLAEIGCSFIKEKDSGGALKEDSGSQLVFSVHGLPSHVQQLYHKLREFMAKEVYPIEKEVMAGLGGNEKWEVNPLIEELKEKAHASGLWNLFLPISLDKGGKVGAGLTNLQYAFFCEEMGKVLFAPEIFNCSAPDTGNMEVLLKYGTPQQQEEWLKPLLNGTIRSCFGMTEPNVASSDATNIESSIIQDGADYVINGRKWWTSGAMDPRCKLCIFMGKTDVNAPKHRQQSMILVPLNTHGVNIVRPLSVFGFQDPPAGHAEIEFTNVRVPVENILLGEGRGFEIAQGRLGPGRIHHCMRLIGYAERALALMIERTGSRTAFGKPILAQGTIQSDIADSRVEIEQARLLTLKAAHMMDTVGNKVAAAEIAMIKVVAPMMAQRVIDRAMQSFGGAGLSQDTPLAHLFTLARVLRLADGPDEVHKQFLSRMEIKKHSKSRL